MSAQPARTPPCAQSVALLDQHSPGPWLIGHLPSGNGFWVGPSEDRAVARVHHVTHSGRRNETLANARLLGGALIMRDALEEIAREHPMTGAAEAAEHRQAVALEAIEKIEALQP